jgi:hypothetical protein
MRIQDCFYNMYRRNRTKVVMAAAGMDDRNHLALDHAVVLQEMYALSN